MADEEKLLKGRKLTGLPVILMGTGKELGEVKEILVDTAQTRICALLLEEGGWLKGAKLVIWQDLQHIGENTVTVADEDVIRDCHDNREYQELCKQRIALKGFRLITETGAELGMIEDILFNTTTGEIAGYELSKGVVQDLLEGRWEAFLPENAKIGPNTVVVPDGETHITQTESKN